MGCKNSKDGKQDDKAINSDFKHIGIPRFDDFFNGASGLLSRAETIRGGVEDSKEKGSELAGTWQLKDPKYIDTAQVLFWAISANSEGKIANAGVDVTNEAPYLTLDHKKVTGETHELYSSLETYLKTVAEGPITLKEIVEKLQETSTKVPDLVKEGKDEIQNSSLDLRGKANAVMALTKNGDQLATELDKCRKLQGILEQATTDMKELIPKLRDLKNQADEVGAKASADKLAKPSEIFNKYHTGARKEVDKKKEGKEEKKKEEKGKKDESPKKKEDKKEKKEKKEKKDESPKKKDEKKDEKKEKKEESPKKEDKKEEHHEKKEEHHEKKDEPHPHVAGESVNTH